MQQRREKGLWNGGLVPYGYKNVDKKLEIDEKDAEGVKKIFQIFLETQSLAETRRRINQLGYKTRKGNIFCKGSIDNILRNPIYIGKIEHKGKLFDGIHKAIIPEAMFLKVQSLRRIQIRPETKIKRPFLLRGLLKCQECGSVMTPSYTLKQEKKGRRYIYYYRCTKTCKHDWQSCSIKYVNANRIEEFITKKLTDISKDESTIEKLVRRINQDEEQRLSPLREKEKHLQARIDEIDCKVKKLVSFLSESDDRLFPTVKKELSGLEQEKKILEFDLEGVRLSIQKESKEKFEAKIVLENLRNFIDRLQEIKDEEKPYLFQYLIKDIIYGKDEIGVNLFYLPNFRANLPKHRQSGGTARVTAGGEPVLPSFVPSYIGLKNRSRWLRSQNHCEPSL
ncbi:MAG: recombinase family protein [Candidatus Caldarchaeum sp.]